MNDSPIGSVYFFHLVNKAKRHDALRNNRGFTMSAFTYPCFCSHSVSVSAYRCLPVRLCLFACLYVFVVLAVFSVGDYGHMAHSLMIYYSSFCHILISSMVSCDRQILESYECQLLAKFNLYLVSKI